MRETTKATLEPVRLSGLYEHTDGSVGYYYWETSPSRPVLAWVEPDWIAARARNARADVLPDNEAAS